MDHSEGMVKLDSRIRVSESTGIESVAMKPP